MALTDEQKKTILDCETEVLEVLKKHTCHLEGMAVLRPGTVDVQIIVAINEPIADTTAPGPVDEPKAA